MLNLKNVLLLNGVSSGITGILLSLFSGQIASFFEVIVTIPFICAGVFLILFALFVLYVSQNISNRKAIRLIIILDWAWVISSVILLIFIYSSISIIGIVSIAFVAIWVALMAYLQAQYSSDLKTI